MATQINHLGLTTGTKVYRVSLSGPYSMAPSGKWNRHDEPIMRRCEPYWIVRTMHGASASIMQDYRFYSQAVAQAYYDSLPPY